MDITYSGHSSFRVKTKTGVIHLGLEKISIENSEGKVKEISGPGEYEISGISVIGVSIDQKNIFIIEAEKLRIAFLTEHTTKLTSEHIDQIGSIDVLIMPTSQASIISEIDPYFVVPVGENIEAFLKEVGLQVDSLPKFSIKKEDILEDQNTKVIVLNAR